MKDFGREVWAWHGETRAGELLPFYLNLSACFNPSHVAAKPFRYRGCACIRLPAGSRKIASTCIGIQARPRVGKMAC